MDLHVFFLPFLAQGHMIPMLDLASLFSSRGVTSTIVATRSDAARAAVSHPHLRLLTLPDLSNSGSMGPSNCLMPEFSSAFSAPFFDLLAAHRPDCLVADFMVTWAPARAAALGIPVVTFNGTCVFAVIAAGIIHTARPHERVAGDDVPFVLPGLPHRIELTRSQLATHFKEPPTERNKLIEESHKKCYGMVMNSFYEMEAPYANIMKMAGKMKLWNVGPLSLHRTTTTTTTTNPSSHHSLRWLAGKLPNSVLYLCFGSVIRFTAAQLREIALGLVSSNRPFIWVVRADQGDDVMECLPNDHVGLVLTEWAPQVEILGHVAVGGFVTHCGWNSCMEAITAGVSVVTWPLCADQFFNERLLVDVLKTGVEVGARAYGDKEEEWELVGKELAEAAARRVMGGDSEAAERRRRAEELEEAARKAVEKGGSSYNDLTGFIDELVEMKRRGKFGNEE